MRLLDEACEAGARRHRACKVVGLHPRTVERWHDTENTDDMRIGPKTRPSNALTKAEENEVLGILNSPEYRDLSPKQIVPRLADAGVYVASESTMERLLRRRSLNKHRGPKRQRSHAKPREKTAIGPGQVWSWDITCLRTKVVGRFFYLYMTVDVWSRKIVAHSVQERECSQMATELMAKAIRKEDADATSLVLHSDNGGPMKGTLKASMENLGVRMSYSRPHVSDDNPYSESLFGTMKTRPEYPRRPFKDIQEARNWCEAFVRWYNNEHRHSAIGYVTPAQRHGGKSSEILARRKVLYERARQRNPRRWSRQTRKWNEPGVVFLNPDKETMAR